MGLYKFTVKNNMPFWGRFIYAAILFAVVLLCAVSLLVPARQLHFEKCVPQTDDIIANVFADGVVYFNNCDISNNGEVTVTGGDAYFVIPGYEKEIRVVKLNFKIPSANEYYATLYYDDGGEFSQEKTVVHYVLEGDTDICFKIPASTNKNIRIDIDDEYTFESVELHSKAPDIIEIPITVSKWNYVSAILIALLISILFFFFDKYIFPVSEKIKNYYICNYKGILMNAIVLLCAVVVAIGVEYILGRFVFGVSSVGTHFNMYRYFFIACVLSAIMFLLRHIKCGSQNSEKLFVVLMLIMGICMILCSPFGHVIWDYETHSRFVLDQSYFGDVYITMADEIITTNEEFFYSKENIADNLRNIDYLNSVGDIVVRMRDGMKTTIAHIPAGLTSAVFRFMGFPYVTIVLLGRTANLCLYTLLCYCAMRKLKSGKMILTTIAFFPTNIFLATNYSYDWWLTSLVMLGVAYYMNEIQHPQKMPTAINTVIMCGAFILACIPKQIYMPIMILPFFMYKKWKDISAKKRYYLICVAMFIFMFVLLIIRSQKSITGGGDMRGGSEVNSMEQVRFILSKPLEYTKTLLKFLKTYLSIGSMKDYITNFAYLRSGGLSWLFIAILVITSLTDKCQNDSFKGLGLIRIVSIILFFGISCLIATSMYVAFTAVGSNVIAGCQGRYLTPLLFPLLVVIASPGIKLKIKKEIYNTIVLSVLSTTVFYNIGTVMLSKLM